MILENKGIFEVALFNLKVDCVVGIVTLISPFTRLSSVFGLFGTVVNILSGFQNSSVDNNLGKWFIKVKEF